jgi:tRNA(Ile)-lysidine synthase
MDWNRIVAAAIERHGMLSAGNRIGVAVSGGADSVFLLHALRELGLTACVLHVNHKLRGAEADRDEDFVRGLAGRWEIPFYAACRPIAAGNVEQEARRARYEFFAERIQAGCCDRVATGHTLDDQAETVIGRFLRGAGTAGLRGILPVTEAGIIRPLLGLRRDEIRKWLGYRGMAWQEDCTNTDTDLLRNRIRMELIPELIATLNPGLPEVLGATAEWARAEEEFWRAEVERLESRYLKTGAETVLIETRPFLELSLAVQRRLLRRGIEAVRKTLRGIDFRHIEAIRGLMHNREGSGRIQIPDLDIYRSFDWLRLAPPGFDSRQARDFDAVVNVPGLTEIPGRMLKLEMKLVTNNHVYTKDVNALDRERCVGTLVLRNWRPGDRICPSGETRDRKIKTLFQDFRIPLWERRHWPVIVNGNRIVWTRGFGVAREFAAGPETGTVLLVQETGESNCSLATSIEMKHARREPGQQGAEVL